MTRLDADWLRDDATQQALGLLTGAGHQAFVVGGCVRNALLGVPVNDVDIATSAPPETVIELADAAGIRSVPTGVDHGTVTLVIDGQGFEITTFRRDVETDGRRAVVSFSATLEDDAARRDFTMNALYADADGTVTDPVNGLPDLRERHVRFVGHAEDRIREDYLRSLRFFRFHAQYGDPERGLDADALAAIAGNLDGLGQLAAERVWSELRKLLSAADPAPALAAMETSGVLGRLLPGASSRFVGPLVYLEGEGGIPPEAIRRLAALGGAGGDLRLSRQDARRLDTLRSAVEKGTGLAELAWREGAEIAWDAALLRAALSEAPLAPETGRVIARGMQARFPLTAADLMPDLSGAALGRALKVAERAWIDSDFSLDRQSLEGVARKAG